MQTIKITTSQNIDIDYQVAGLGDRIAARLIDYSIFFGIYYVFMIVILVFPSAKESKPGDSNTTIIISMIIWLILCVLYDLITEIFFNGQSVGKRSLKIKVISLNGERPTVGQYFLRWIFRIVDFGITLGSAAIVSIVLTENKQRIGDLLAGTAIIKTSPKSSLKELVFRPAPEDYEPVHKEALHLNDQDMVLIQDVIKNFNRTGNSLLVYKLALRIQEFLQISCPPELNEYQFLEQITHDYNHLIMNKG